MISPFLARQRLGLQACPPRPARCDNHRDRFLLRSKAQHYLYYRSWQKALSREGSRTCWLLGQRISAVVRDLKETREEGPSDFRGGVNRGRKPGGVPVGASRWRCRTTDVVRGRSFPLHFAPVRSGSWGGAWEFTPQTLEGSKKTTHATVEKARDVESVRIRERTGESAETGTRIDKRGQDAQKVYLHP